MVAGNVPGLKGKLFKQACETKLANLRRDGTITHAFWDRLVFRKVGMLFLSFAREDG